MKLVFLSLFIIFGNLDVQAAESNCNKAKSVAEKFIFCGELDSKRFEKWEKGEEAIEAIFRYEGNYREAKIKLYHVKLQKWKSDLSILDQDLNSAYRDLSAKQDHKSKINLIAKQKEWIKERDLCMDKDSPSAVNDCIKATYEARVLDLKKMNSKPKLVFKPFFRKKSKDGKMTFFEPATLDAYEELSKMKKKCTPMPEFENNHHESIQHNELAQACVLNSVLQSAHKPKSKFSEITILEKIWDHFSANDVFGRYIGKVKLTDNGYEFEDGEEKVKILAFSDFDADGQEDVLVERSLFDCGAVCHADGSYYIFSSKQNSPLKSIREESISLY